MFLDLGGFAVPNIDQKLAPDKRSRHPLPAVLICIEIIIKIKQQVVQHKSILKKCTSTAMQFSVWSRQAARRLHSQGPLRLSPCGIGAGSSGEARAGCATACTAHSTPHMSHNHITTLHYLIIGTTFTQLNRYGHLTMLITPIGTIMLWKRSSHPRIDSPDAFYHIIEGSGLVINVS
ncbi:Uncharacterized protein OBRU01_09669 [Operophtera brumata]|uniref:Uncharacterized protein n=1 Tax=Operophtera brumata TaxID=104452 RepID=A0A0L7LFL4_OPEBR|nr:Uncharacterized protein OBRU01_09669 [Operophtera brumata]